MGWEGPPESEQWMSGSGSQKKPVDMGAFVPLGQGTPEKEWDDDDVAANKAWWQFDAPSFEVWAAATCYDSSKADGGEVFQRLMHWALTEQRGAAAKDEEQGFGRRKWERPTAHWNAELEGDDRYIGNHWIELDATEDRYRRYDSNGTQAGKGNKGVVKRYPFTDASYAQSRYPGGRVGRTTDQTDDMGGFISGRGKVKQELKEVMTSKPATTSGKAMFLWTAGLSEFQGGSCGGTTGTGGGDKAGPNLNVQWIMVGNASETDKRYSPQHGCVPISLRLAAYYGLYYYPNCRRDDWNWTEQCTVGGVGGTKYHIRMRMPNPSFAVDKKWELMVDEPQNNVYTMNDGKDVIDHSIDKGVWDKDGRVRFSFPRMARDRGVDIGDKDRRLTWDYLGEKGSHEKIVCAIGGFAGDDEEANLRWRQSDKTSTKHHDELSKMITGDWAGRFYRVERQPWSQGAFGWTPPAALFLYPHYGPKDETVEARGKEPKYQPWPDLLEKDPLKHPFITWSREQELMEFFTLPPKNAAERQKAALGEKFDGFEDWDAAKAWLKLDKSDEPAAREPAHAVGVDNATAVDHEEEAEHTRQPPRAQEPAQEGIRDEAHDGEEQQTTDESNAVNSDLVLYAGVDFGGVPVAMSAAEMLDDDVGVTLQNNANRNSSKELKAGINELTDDEKVLPFGSAHRAKDPSGNHHFFSLNHSPWAPRDVYMENKHEYEYDTMTSDEQKDYEFLYGSMANTLLRHENPHKIIGVKNTFGEVKKLANGKSILDARLDAYRTDASLTADERALFRKNMRRILSIYHDESGTLGRNNVKLTDQEKRMGMLEGTWVTRTRCKHDCTTGVGKPTRSTQRLLPPVFSDTAANKREIEATKAGVTTEGPEGKRFLLRGEKVEADRPAVDVQKIVAPMTVLQWLQTPWHFEYLPYQPVHSVFKDGETYCAGCTRCSRPFYEYKSNFAHYARSVPGTRHWPHSYWRRGAKGDADMRIAPRPFHDPDFWSDAYVPKKQQVPEENLAGANDGEDETLLPVNERGFHNWATKIFLLGYAKSPGQPPVRKVKPREACSDENPLCEEWTKRKELMPRAGQRNRTDYDVGNYWTFREYINHVYDPEAEYAKYLLVQGAMRSKRSSVAYGMQEYRLMRSVKYGNTCRDCAFILDAAPKLYIRSGNTTASEEMLRQAQTRPEMMSDTFWIGMKDLKLADGSLFDPWFIYLNTSQDRLFHHQGVPESREVRGRAPRSRSQVAASLGLDDDKKLDIVNKPISIWKKLKQLWKPEGRWLTNEALQKKFDMHMDAAAKYLKMRNCQLENADGPLTKVVSCTVNVQKTWSKGKNRMENAKNWAAGDEAKIKAGVKVMETFLQWLQDVWEKKAGTEEQCPITATGLGEYNRALFDMLRDAQFEMSRQHAFSLDPETSVKKFDSNMTRDEWRDWTDGEWKNCLRVKTLQAPHLVKNPATGEGFQTPDEAYKEVIYRCNRKGALGLETETPEFTEWRGDGYILEYKNGKWVRVRGVEQTKESGRVAFQKRRLTQSRVFITYSLHRRIRSEEEARWVMEKMANAVRALFGNDKWFCEIVRFGTRVSATGGPPDSVASKHLTFIDKPRKETTRFYGGTDGNSYLFDTYQTHVESVDVDVGVEIGPTYHMPHFHALVTINHWSYVQIDTMRMRSILEQMFKGTGRFQHAKEEFGLDTKLFDNAGLPFYTDNENPYVDIRLYPSDNWDEVIRAYVRKTAQPGILEAQMTRMGS